MNYNKSLRKENAFIANLKKQIKDNSNFMNSNFELQNINLIEYYKDFDTLLVLFLNKEESTHLSIFVHMDLFQLEINNIKFTYSMYKKKDKKEIDNFFSKNINYTDLQGNSINEKVKFLYYSINEQIDRYVGYINFKSK